MLPRRAVIAIVATALGLVLLLSFKTTPAPTFGQSAIGVVPAGAGAAVSPVPAVTPAPSSGTANGGDGTSGGATGPGPVATPTPTPPAAVASGSGTVTGQAVDTPFGTVQVEVTMASGRIADVQAIQLPNDRRRSAMISQYVGPVLRSEALTAQSARIDLISGATYTSEGYAESLQSALDKSHG
jgi:uncharacterized protein with FMN-binding domain